ncbi:MAG: homoserine dehydrogenase, partial [Planctomycetes bacterium]|nr:homoserine dehydrogenase [Planctomycetota bacterium]
MPALKIALIGLGTVGTGVAKILLEHSEQIARRAGRSIEIRRVVVRDLHKAREVDLPEGVLTDDLQSVISDDQIDVAVQLIGGIDPARRIMTELLESGKEVVTANKALLCEHGDELFSLARELGRTISFEAAVAGGIPIVAALGQSLAANQITSLEAILNGTSNFILTQMLTKNRPYQKALRQAQDLGYAEADPTMDVDGTDAAQKLVLLVQLAFGTKVALTEFSRQGIESLELADLKYAEELGYTVKLLAVAKLVDGQLEMHIQPTLVHQDRPLAKVDGAFNMIAVEGDAVGRLWFSGPGAGQMATASAVVADIIDTAVGRAALTFSRLDLWQERTPLRVQPVEEIKNRYYLRFNVEDRPHVFADIADILGRHKISLASIIQHEAPELDEGNSSLHPVVAVVVMT